MKNDVQLLDYTVAHYMIFNPGDVGDYEAREHGDGYLDGMVFAPNQVIKCSYQLQGKCNYCKLV